MAIFRLDPCGIICIILTYLAVFYADYAVVEWMVIPTMSSRYVEFFHACLMNKLSFEKERHKIILNNIFINFENMYFLNLRLENFL